MSKNDADPAVKPPIWRVYAYRAAVVFFILGTFLQIPFTYFSFVYAFHLKHASLESVCDMDRRVKEHFGWSYEENLP